MPFLFRSGWPRFGGPVDLNLPKLSGESVIVHPQLSHPRVLSRKTALICIVILALLVLFFLSGEIYADEDRSTGHADEVQLCFDQFGYGQHVHGILDDEPYSAFAGVLEMRVDNVSQQAFCMDIRAPLDQGTCYDRATIGVIEPKASCVLQYYPPTELTTPEDRPEIAARQAAIWYFSDDFRLAITDNVFSRYQTIVEDIETKFAEGKCTPIDNWQLTVDPVATVHELVSDGAGGYLATEQNYTIQLRQGILPVADHDLTIETDQGILMWNGQTGQVLTVQTDSNGTAVVTLQNDGTIGKSTVDVRTKVHLPVGTRIDPGIDLQKVLISGKDEHVLHQRVTAEWLAGAHLVVKKFDDENLDGIFNNTDRLIDWDVRICESGTDSCEVYSLGPDGTETIAVDPDKAYDLCELFVTDWTATTPICHFSVEPPTTVWFGNHALPALRIEKFHDLNGNGEREKDEPPLDGWGFQVDYWYHWTYDLWAPAYSGNTSYNGVLGFTDIEYRTYRIQEELPATESWYPSIHQSAVVTVEAPSVYTVTFGNIQPAALTLTKEWMINEVRTEPPETPATICLKRVGPGTPVYDLVPTVDGTELMINNDGHYCYERLTDSVVINNLWPGDYDLTESSPTGWMSKTSNVAVALSSGEQDQTVNFVNSLVPHAEYRFKKYINGEDANTLVQAVQAELDESLEFQYVVTNKGDIAITWTTLMDDVFGDLTAECKLPVTISVGQSGNCTVIRPAGDYPQGQRNIGTVTVKDLDDQNDPAWYQTEEVSDVKPMFAQLGDYVWHDLNENGIQDLGEEPIPDVKVELFYGDGTPVERTTTTNLDGFYLFDRLIPGEYIVTFQAPDNYRFTTPEQGNDQAKDSNAYVTKDERYGTSKAITLAASESNLTIDAGLYVVSPNLTLTKDDGSPTSVQPGSTITYTLRYTNSGRGVATGVVIHESVPQYTTLALQRSTPGWICANNDITPETLCAFNISSVGANESGEVKFVVNVNMISTDTTTEIVNDATISHENQSPKLQGIVAIEKTILSFPSSLPPSKEPTREWIFLPVVVK